MDSIKKNTKPTLPVHSVETFGTKDGPGIRLVIFTQGCNLHCLYCQNPDTQALRTDSTKYLSIDEILKLLKRQESYSKKEGGITVSGGEPTLHAPFLLQLFAECKKLGFHTALDTNGTLHSLAIRKLYDVTDLLLLDVKHIDDPIHRKLTGGSNQVVLQNAEHRERTGKEMWLRYVVVPGWSDQVEYIKKWAERFGSYKSIKRVEILPYHTLGCYKYEALGRKNALEGVKPPTSKKINEVFTEFTKHFSCPIIIH